MALGPNRQSCHSHDSVSELSEDSQTGFSSSGRKKSSKPLLSIARSYSMLRVGEPGRVSSERELSSGTGFFDEFSLALTSISLRF